MNYNRQPYGPNGDTPKNRTIKWYQDQVFGSDRYRDLCWRPNAWIADIGCGNGRFCPILSKDFTSVHAYDPAEPFDNRFARGNVTFWKAGLKGISNQRTYNVLIFLGSLYIILQTQGLKAIRKCEKILEPEGRVFALLAASNRLDIDLLDWSRHGWNVRMTNTEDQTSVIFEAWRS